MMLFAFKQMLSRAEILFALQLSAATTGVNKNHGYAEGAEMEGLFVQHFIHSRKFIDLGDKDYLNPSIDGLVFRGVVGF